MMKFYTNDINIAPDARNLKSTFPFINLLSLCLKPEGGNHNKWFSINKTFHLQIIHKESCYKRKEKQENKLPNAKSYNRITVCLKSLSLIKDNGPNDQHIQSNQLKRSFLAKAPFFNSKIGVHVAMTNLISECLQ